MRERLPDQRGCDAETLRDQSVEYGLEGGQHFRLSCLNEHAERPADRQPTFVCHLAADTLVDEKEICPEGFGGQNGGSLAWIEPEV
jgi:hypothetical protein